MLPEAPYHSEALDALMQGKSILVTGGTGSFGRAFIRLLLDEFAAYEEAAESSGAAAAAAAGGPQTRAAVDKTRGLSRIVIFSRDELKQSEMQAQLASHPAAALLRFFIGDVRDRERLLQAFTGVDIVVHAAALKQVPAIEYNPFEAIKTNVLGAENIIHAAIEKGVTKVCALSTDKACTPVNLYGASKLCSDKLFIAGNAMVGAGNTSFCVVRYGNVFGSRGSIVPVFLDKLHAGVASLPVTDNAMTRFTISLGQAVNLVLMTLEKSCGGELFVPRIPSYTIGDLVDAIAGEDYPRHVTGIRPGEKLHEMMIPLDEAHNTRQFDDFYVVFPAIAFGHESAAHGSRTEALHAFAAAGEPVPATFCYASNTNTSWITVAEMRTQVEAAHRKFFGGAELPKEWPGAGAGGDSAALAAAQGDVPVVCAQPTLNAADVAAVTEVLSAGTMLTTGPKVPRFEAALAEYVGAAHAVAVSNGTAALHCAYAALQGGCGALAAFGGGGGGGDDAGAWSATDAVVVPAITFAATANAVKYVGGTPVFADVDPTTLLVTPAAARAAAARAAEAGLTVRAVVGVDFAGQHAPIAALAEVARELKAALVLDAAHSLGARTVGAATAFAAGADILTMSFHPVKTITTAEGGAVLCNDAGVADRARGFRQHGMLQHQAREASGKLVSDQSVLGYNYRLTDVQCALGLSQLERIGLFLEKRARAAAWYAEAFAAAPEAVRAAVTPLATADTTEVHARHLFVVRLNGADAERRAAVFAAMKERGVGVNVHYIPVYTHSYYQKKAAAAAASTPPHHLGHDACPEADRAANEILSLPMHANLTRAAVHKVVSTLSSIVSEQQQAKK